MKKRISITGMFICFLLAGAMQSKAQVKTGSSKVSGIRGLDPLAGPAGSICNCDDLAMNFSGLSRIANPTIHNYRIIMEFKMRNVKCEFELLSLSVNNKTVDLRTSAVINNERDETGSIRLMAIHFKIPDISPEPAPGVFVKCTAKVKIGGKICTLKFSARYDGLYTP